MWLWPSMTLPGTFSSATRASPVRRLASLYFRKRISTSVYTRRYSPRPWNLSSEPAHRTRTGAPQAETSAETPCSESHHFEVTGHADVAARTLPADNAAWDRVIGPACREAAARYLGRAPDGRRTNSGWLPIVPERAGRPDAGGRSAASGSSGADGNPEPVSGPIRDHTG
ncbi:MAG: septum formation family protein [Actinomycetota bacterium]